MIDELDITINKLINHVLYLYLTATSQDDMNHIKVIKIHRNLEMEMKLHIITLIVAVNTEFSLVLPTN
jgi:hypothetical protein